MLTVNEIFHSIQGESTHTGRPCVFVRLTGCDLRCVWCDTPYAFHEGRKLDVDEVVAAVEQYRCDLVEITGGEPLLQQRELAPLAATLKRRGYYCEVETNGTIVPQPDLVRDIDQWNVSPKLATSGNTEERRDQKRAMDALSRLPNAYFKFVVTEPRDVDEVRTLRDKYGLLNQQIILMPEGTTIGNIERRSPWVSEACVKEGFRFSTRLHILLWGDKRGR